MCSVQLHFTGVTAWVVTCTVGAADVAEGTSADTVVPGVLATARGAIPAHYNRHEQIQYSGFSH